MPPPDAEAAADDAAGPCWRVSERHRSVTAAEAAETHDASAITTRYGSAAAPPPPCAAGRRNAPSGGPTMRPAAPATAKRPSTAGREAGDATSRTTACETDIWTLTPVRKRAACSTASDRARDTIRSASACENWSVTTTGRRPRRSLSGPATALVRSVPTLYSDARVPMSRPVAPRDVARYGRTGIVIPNDKAPPKPCA